mgnify:CR=1 FL=1
MCSIKEVIESAGLPAERGVYTGKKKPAAYCTFLRLHKGAAVNADDEESSGREVYRLTLFCKGKRRLVTVPSPYNFILIYHLPQNVCQHFRRKVFNAQL